MERERERERERCMRRFCDMHGHSRAKGVFLYGILGEMDRQRRQRHRRSPATSVVSIWFLDFSSVIFFLFLGSDIYI